MMPHHPLWSWLAGLCAKKRIVLVQRPVSHRDGLGGAVGSSSLSATMWLMTSVQPVRPPATPDGKRRRPQPNRALPFVRARNPCRIGTSQQGHGLVTQGFGGRHDTQERD